MSPKRGKAEAQQPAEPHDKPKKTRTYKRYLQKKFTPAIITDTIANLSEAQSKWVRKAGFEHVLRHRNRIFPHRMAYNVVEAFDSEKCALVLQAGTVYITERLVHNVLGLPQGENEIKLSKSRITRCDWDEQYDTTQITPTMIKDKILESPRADYNFKMNFLILMYNFLIEANQNGYVKRDFLSFEGNIDLCGTYNWCSLLLRKLRVTHEFWADAKWRNFAGPLPCLIVRYAWQVFIFNFFVWSPLLTANMTYVCTCSSHMFVVYKALKECILQTLYPGITDGLTICCGIVRNKKKVQEALELEF